MLCSRPSTEGSQLKENVHYENADLYENMPSLKLATRYPPKPTCSSASSFSTSKSNYKAPVSKISSKFLTADTKTKDTAQVTNTLLFNSQYFPTHPKDRAKLLTNCSCVSDGTCLIKCLI